MRSSIRYSVVAVAALALMIGTFIALRSRLEQKVTAQSAGQVAACDATVAPSKTNPCLVISAFRENGPGTTAALSGNQDEFVEIFNASAVDVTVSALSDDPIPSNGIGVFVSAGMGFNPTFGQTANEASLACQIKGATVIHGRTWFLCGGQRYSLSNLGGNGGRFHSIPDAIIGTQNATLATTDIPDDAGIALLNVGQNIVTQCTIGGAGCPTGFNFSAIGGTGNAVVLDKVGFNSYGPGSPENTGPGLFPANIYPSLASQYCEGTCLQPVGDASTVFLGPGVPCPTTQQDPPNPTYGPGTGPQEPGTHFPTQSGGFITQANGVSSSTLKCYGESGQYKIERRRSASTDTSTAGQIYRDSWRSTPLASEYPFPIGATGPTGACAGPVTSGFCGNSEDFILDAPNPSTANVGETESGVALISSVLGATGIHNCDSSFHNGYLDGTGCTPARPGGITAYDGAGSAPVIGNSASSITLTSFDPGCTSLNISACPGFANAERRYSQDASIFGVNNDPLGVLILRFRITNLSAQTVAGGRFRINDATLPCGGQTGTFGSTTRVGTQEARNLRGPNNATQPAVTPTPTCGTSGSGDGSDGVSAFTAILKALNTPGEFVVDSTFTKRSVWGTVLEDTSTGAGNPLPASTPALGVLSPFGGGSDSSLVLQSTATGNATINIWPLAGPFTNVGTGLAGGVNGGVGSYNFPAFATGAVIRVGFKFGVVKQGRAKLVIGRELTGPTPLP